CRLFFFLAFRATLLLAQTFKLEQSRKAAFFLGFSPWIALRRISPPCEASCQRRDGPSPEASISARTPKSCDGQAVTWMSEARTCGRRWCGFSKAPGGGNRKVVGLPFPDPRS